MIQHLTDSEGGKCRRRTCGPRSPTVPSQSRRTLGALPVSVQQDSAVDGETVNVVMNDAGNEVAINGVGNGPIAAFCEALSRT